MRVVRRVRARSARCARCPLGSRHFAVLRREEEERKTAGRAEYERVERSRRGTLDFGFSSREQVLLP